MSVITNIANVGFTQQELDLLLHHLSEFEKDLRRYRIDPGPVFKAAHSKIQMAQYQLRRKNNDGVGQESIP